MIQPIDSINMFLLLRHLIDSPEFYRFHAQFLAIAPDSRVNLPTFFLG